jgi:hypothetical protein
LAPFLLVNHPLLQFGSNGAETGGTSDFRFDGLKIVSYNVWESRDNLGAGPSFAGWFL